MRFDVLIRGGEVLDPGAGLAGVLDVAISGGRVAAVEASIPPDSAGQVIDASGQLVTPGLVDLHTHIYPGATYWGIRPDPVAAQTGVTTWVDAGSAGAMNLLGMREYLERTSRVRCYAFLNIATTGLVGETYELMNLELVSPELCVKLARLNADVVRGVKARIAAQTLGQSGLEPLHRALAAAEQLDVPLMVHIGGGPPEIGEVAELLRPGDLLTHAFTGYSMRLTEENGTVRDPVRRALDRGVLLDLGHGAGGFSFEVAEQMAAAGVFPHVISTDLHQRSLWGPVYDLPTCIEKALVLGMSLPDAIDAATAVPARVLGLSGLIGTLRPGAPADVALFRVETGAFQLQDTRGVARTGNTRLHNTLTLVAGRPLPPEPPNQPAPWI
jgi:dihydroorotase